jgi:hypothetical protein
VSKNNNAVRASDYECVHDEASLDVRKAILNAKKRAREDVESIIPKLFNEEL